MKLDPDKCPQCVTGDPEFIEEVVLMRTMISRDGKGDSWRRGDQHLISEHPRLETISRDPSKLPAKCGQCETWFFVKVDE